jgi:transcriptional regulator with XRE-family HTH domain
MNELDIHIGQRLKQRRLELRFSQAELGKHLGLSLEQIRKYENGLQSMKVGVLYGICSKLQVEYSYFFFGLGNGVTYNCNNNKVSSDEIGKLIKIYREINDVKVRLMLMNIAKEICKFSKNCHNYMLDDVE